MSKSRPKSPNRISEIRKLQSMSQQELGALVGAHFVTISKLETGKLPLTQEWVARIADALRVDQAEIVSGPQKRRVYITGTVEGGARVDIWDYRYKDEKLFIETDLYTGDVKRVQWIMVNGDVLYPVFQHTDLLRISYQTPIKMEQLQGNLCAIQLGEEKDGPVIVIGIPTTRHDEWVFDIHMLNGPPRRKARIENIALVTAALFKPNIKMQQFKKFQKFYAPFLDDEDIPSYTPIADWLRSS